MKDRIDRLFHTTLLALFALAGAVSGQNLKTVQLPAGSVGGFDIGFPGWNGSNRTKYANPLTELDSNGRPYDGIRFVGAGRGRTHIVPDYAGTTSGDSTIVIGKGCGIVQFEKLTIHAASRKAIHVGEIWDQVSALEPSTLALRRVTVTAGRPALGSGNSTVWGILTYNADIDFEDVRFDLKWTAEHGLYAHGFNKRGIRWVRVDVKAVGAEGLKVATRPEEVAFVPNATILVKQCTFTNWLQPHSWRGGAGMVLQGSSAARIILDRTRFRGASGIRGRCLMIDDGGGTDRFYGPSGKIGVGPANGKVLIRFCGFSAGPGTSSWTDALRVGRISTEPTVVAKSVTILNTGFFGERTKVGVENVGSARVKDCNSARLVQTATQQGVNTTFGSALLIEGNWIPNINQGW